MKKILVALICITLLFLCSCSARYENVTFQEDDDKKCVLYAEEKYFAVSFFAVGGGFVVDLSCFCRTFVVPGILEAVPDKRKTPKALRL